MSREAIITAPYAFAIAKILMKHCGLTFSMAREFAIGQAGKCYPEWRFQGALGFGGKFWNWDGRWYVSCYREDDSPERSKMIEQANLDLAQLRVSFDAGNGKVAPAHIPFIGGKPITDSPHENGHWLWMDGFGWHDCTTKEDAEIATVMDADAAEGRNW